MHFTSWRNEETNLISNFCSYKARFLLMKDAINDQMKQYAVYSNEIDKIQEYINDNILSDDQFDSIAPFTQNIEYQDEY